MHRREFLKAGIIGSASVLLAKPLQAQSRETRSSPGTGTAAEPAAMGGDALAGGFQAPPSTAKPYVWWHWVDRNVSKEGITADLEALHRIGVGGAQIFNIDYQVPRGAIQYLTPEWLDAMRHAAQEADRLGLELGMHNCSGWSSSGGPWVTPDLGMQKVVSTETRWKGPGRFQGRLPRAEVPRFGEFYRDIAVLACRTPLAEVRADARLPAPGSNGPKAYRLPDWSGKAGFGPLAAFHPAWNEPAPAEAIFRRAEILDLSGSCQADGTLSWDAPAGDWTIFRFGYGPNGRPNTHPEVPAGFGLEVDKMNPAALELHFANLITAVLRELGPLAGRSFTNLLIDSYESGPSNWTPRFREEFRGRRGYDLTPYLPALTGRVIDSTELTERFLWDFRRTIADLYHENYYTHFTGLCRERGLTAAFEPYLGPFSIMDNSAVADLPMGEFWTGNAYRRSNARNRLVVSGGHLHGRRIVAAEAFTSAWGSDRFTQDPSSLKALADFQFCEGFNRLYFHDFTHQPWVGKITGPGLTMGPWGMHFARTVTWWEQGRPWIDYVSRCQYLLQAGEPVADLFCYSGEDAGAQPQWGADSLPAIPEGYDFEFVNASLLLAATVQDGHIVLPQGQRARVLILPDARYLTPQVAQKLSELVQGGATLVGPAPARSPSLNNYPACDAAVLGVATEIWGDCDGQSVTEHAAGKGMVYWGRPLGEILPGLGLSPDFALAGSDAAPRVCYKHRRDAATEIYFVANQSGQSTRLHCRFRVTGKTPEFWHADTGIREPAPVYTDADGFITIPVRLDSSDSVFVVFRKPAAAEHAVAATAVAPAPTSGVSVEVPDFYLTAKEGALVVHAWSPGDFKVQSARGRSLTAKVASLPAPLVLNEDWAVTFPPQLGAPGSIQLDTLRPLSRHAEPGVRYFSGTATYTREFELAAEMLAPARDLLLDLGGVRNLAHIKLNGTDLGILWRAPFRVLATPALRLGRNRLEVQVTNLWANRLIGDEHLPDDCEWIAVPTRGWRLKAWPAWLVEGKPRPSARIAFATWRYYDGSEALPDSGLMGPVSLRAIAKVTLAL